MTVSDIYPGKEITFKVGSKTFKYKIPTCINHLSNLKDYNDEIFKALEIGNPEEFCAKAYGYEPWSGMFPECKYDDKEALLRVIEALQKECEKYNAEDTQAERLQPLFKVGDRVRVKSREGSGDDYRFSFTDGMAELAGKVYTISEVRFAGTHFECKVPDDCHQYYLKGPDTGWSWSSGMLELVVDDCPDKDEVPVGVVKTVAEESVPSSQHLQVRCTEREVKLSLKKKKYSF